MLSLGAPEVPNVLPLTTRMAAPPAPSTERIQDLLLRENHITREQLERALREGKSNNLSVTYNLIKTGAIEELIAEIKHKVTILIVTHNMQQAARCSDYTAYMYLGELMEFGETEEIFFKPKRKETEDYITGRFG